MATNELMKRLEEKFFEYAQQYDQNIVAIIQEKHLNVDLNMLQQVLDEAKHRAVH
ncbi:MAG: hypothetical protein UMV23_02120 [Halanaerobium sp.]|nr:hypothetical protein [Halanaerobium sp.]